MSLLLGRLDGIGESVTSDLVGEVGASELFLHLGFGLRCLNLRLARAGRCGFVLRRLRLLILSALHDLLACVDGPADSVGEALFHCCTDAAHCCDL